MKIKIAIIAFLLVVCSAVWFKVGRIKGEEKSEVFREIFFDVGQGDSIFLERGDDQILIDGGLKSEVILGKLSKEMGLDKKIELLVISHWDSDHIGGLLEVAKRYEIGLVLFGGGEPESETAKKLKSFLEERGVELKKAQAGQKIDFDKVIIGVLSPLSEEGESNDLSAVLKVEFGECKTILTGDLGERGEKELVESELDLESDILKVGHHGSKNSSSQIFVETVSPRWSIISLGKENSYGHPHKETLERLENARTEILRTDEKGDIVFESLGEECFLR
jgi:competence protein ComEC